MPNVIQIANGQHRKIIEYGRSFLNALDMRLFVANVVPSGTVQPAYPADECTDSGYLLTAPIVAPFPTAFVTSGAAALAAVSAPTITFSHGGGNFTVYGVYWTDPADGDVTVMAMALDTPFLCTAAGQVFVISGNFCFDTATACPPA